MIFLNKTRDISDLNRLLSDAQLLNSKIQYLVKFNQDNLRFTLSEALSSEEEADLDNLIANFVDQDLELKVPKIYDFVNPQIASKHHHDINYKTELKAGVKFVPKRTIVQGEVVKVEWYEKVDENQQLQNKVLVVDIVYTRDATGFALFRQTTRTWINRDDTDNNDPNITVKPYFINQTDMIDEGIKRRKLIVKSVQIPTLTFMTEALMPLGYSQQSVVLQGRAFMDNYETEFNNFADNSSTITDPADPNFGKKSIVARLEDNDPNGVNKDYNIWLDANPPSLGGLKTIRQYLIEEFSI